MDIQVIPNNTSPINDSLSFKDNSNIIIGRDPSCDVVLDCPNKTISRQHAQITKVGLEHKLTDNSINGTFINNQQTAIGFGKSTILQSNDVIRIGKFIIKVNIPELKSELNSGSGLDESLNNDSLETDTLVNHPKKNNLREYTPQHTPNHQVNIAQQASSANTTIPKNWDITPEATTCKNKKVEEAETATELKYENILLNNLIAGLGLTKEEAEITLTADSMLALGRCLRASLSGMIKQRDQSENIKEQLCFNDKDMLKELNYSSFANFSSPQEFLTTLFSESQKTHSEFPLEVLKCQKEIMEDQAIVHKSYNMAIDSFREELSPFTIDKLYQGRQKSANTLIEKLIPSTGKWEIYKKQWSEKCLGIKTVIKNNFAENIKPIHKKRINDRPLLKKKSK